MRNGDNFLGKYEWNGQLPIEMSAVTFMNPAKNKTMSAKNRNFNEITENSILEVFLSILEFRMKWPS